MTSILPRRTFSALRTQYSQTAPWTCRECLSRSRPRTNRIQDRIQTSAFSTSSQRYTQAGKRAWRERIKLPAQRRKVAIATTIVVVSGFGALAFSERARHVYMAAERSGRVGVTLALCVNDYYWILKKGDEPDFKEKLSACHLRCAKRTLQAMEKNGSIFIKLGQHLSSLNYLLPNEWCDTFIPLQDKCPVSSYSSIEEMVKHDTGKKLEDFFSTFETQAIGAASLAQVHIATLKDSGEKVAVKVQHPSLDEWSKLDLALTRFTFQTLKYWFPEYDLTWLSEEMEVSLPKELDFREEGRNARRTKEYFSKIPRSPLVIPEVYYAERRMLVMEFISGHRPDDLAFLDSNGIDRDEVSAALARIFNEMIFGANAPLHCDPHGGNLAIRLNPQKRKPRNFDIILYDHGLYRDIPINLRRAYAHLWLAVLDVDEARMRKYTYEVAGIGDEEFPIFASAITGRDYRVVKSESGITQSRNAEEKRAFSEALGEGGLLSQLVGLLSRVPRVILLILKTNDLTRSLDENLHTRQGPVRSFMILARYCARTVYEEQVEQIRGSLLWPQNLAMYMVALGGYASVAVKLRVYELYLSARRRLGLNADIMQGREERLNI
ncbi:ABC1-domain-containing protein [Teratosphaeria nubilosa]|uniref:ABC1-domain-containing protein n=1 Tax=Teratosphaeria nubilosa TaxID=161662 RepID=A0A6G1LEG0_9PEZI|nr:ABC1-domain-containing protein [Teratosphaeria nubilosa]